MNREFIVLAVIMLYDYVLVWFHMNLLLLLLLLLCVATKTGISFQNAKEIFNFLCLIQLKQNLENQIVNLLVSMLFRCVWNILL